MRYYAITCKTPYIGEGNIYYVKTPDNIEVKEHPIIQDYVYETHCEWYDENNCNMSREEHEEACYAEIKEITENEFVLYVDEWGYIVI